MKSVGEAMAIGRSFAEALQKAQRSLESPTGPLKFTGELDDAGELLDRCRTPHDGRLGTMLQALRAGATPESVAEATGSTRGSSSSWSTSLRYPERWRVHPSSTSGC